MSKLVCDLWDWRKSKRAKKFCNTLYDAMSKLWLNYFDYIKLNHISRYYVHLLSSSYCALDGSFLPQAEILPRLWAQILSWRRFQSYKCCEGIAFKARKWCERMLSKLHNVVSGLQNNVKELLSKLQNGINNLVSHWIKGSLSKTFSW